MIAKDIVLNNEWVDVYTELGVTKDKILYIQNKSLGSVYLWPKATQPETQKEGIHLKVGEYTSVDSQGDGLFATGNGYIYASSINPGSLGSTDMSAVGSINDAVASTDTGSFSILAFIKRSMVNWTTLLERIPALVGGKIPVDATGLTLSTTDTKNGTRYYDFINSTNTVFNGTSSTAITLPTLGVSREVMMQSTEKCFIRFGTYSVTAAVAFDNGQLTIEAGERFHFRIAPEVTHYRIIRETVDGNLTITPVVS